MRPEQIIKMEGYIVKSLQNKMSDLEEYHQRSYSNPNSYSARRYQDGIWYRRVIREQTVIYSTLCRTWYFQYYWFIELPTASSLTLERASINRSEKRISLSIWEYELWKVFYKSVQKFIVVFPVPSGACTISQ